MFAAEKVANLVPMAILVMAEGEEKGARDTNGLFTPDIDRRRILIATAHREARIGYVYSCTDRCIAGETTSNSNSLVRYKSLMDTNR